MSKNHELWYAEAKQGLDISSSGFTTVKETEGIPQRLKRHMEQLSCYDNYSDFQDHTRYCFSICTISSDTWYVLSKASFAVGYSHRAGFFCHHVAIHRSQKPSVVPAVLLKSNLLESRWDSKVERLSDCRSIPRVSKSAGICSRWQKQFGDSGAAGHMLMEAKSNRSLYVPVSEPSQALGLMEEASLLLANDEAWRLTFTTYVSSDVEKDICSIKFFPDPAPQHMFIPGHQVFTYSKRLYEDGAPKLVMAARTGSRVEQKKAKKPHPNSISLLPEPDEPQLAEADPPARTTPLASPEPRRKGVRQQTGPRSPGPVQLSDDSAPMQRPYSHSFADSDRKGSRLVDGMIGVCIGLAVTLVACLPFILGLNSKTGRQEASLVALQEELDKATEEAKSAKNDLKQLQDKSNQKTKSQDDVLDELRAGKEKQIRDLKSEIANTKQKISELENDNDTLKFEIDEEKTKLQDLQRSAEAKLKKANEEIAELEEQLAMAVGNAANKDGPRGRRGPRRFLNKFSELKVMDLSLTSPIEIDVDGPVNTLRIVNWPAKKMNKRFSYDRRNGELNLFYDRGKPRLAKIFQTKDGKKLKLEWNEDFDWERDKPSDLLTRTFKNRILQELSRNAIAFMPENEDGPSYENFVQLRFIFPDQ